jgi:hypothetical protein
MDDPVAFIDVTNRTLEWAKPTRWETPTVVNLPFNIPLYIAPPQREWVGLTDVEISQMEKDCLWGGKDFNGNLGYWAVYRAIEALLKEKNA